MASSIFGWFRDNIGLSSPPSGAMHVNTTQAQTGADTNETDLWTYSLPANTLSADSRMIRVTAWGTSANTANNKTLKLYMGGSVVLSSGAQPLQVQSWVFEGLLIRTGASAEAVMSRWSRDGTNLLVGNVAALAVDTAAAISIKVTGQNGTAAAGDIVFKGALVEILN